MLLQNHAGSGSSSSSSSPEANTVFRNKRAHFWRCLHRSGGGAAVSPRNNLLLLSVKRSSVLIDTFMAFMNLTPKDLRKRWASRLALSRIGIRATPCKCQTGGQ